MRCLVFNVSRRTFGGVGGGCGSEASLGIRTCRRKGPQEIKKLRAFILSSYHRMRVSKVGESALLLLYACGCRPSLVVEDRNGGMVTVRIYQRAKDDTEVMGSGRFV